MRLFGKFFGNRSGNFGIIFAVVLPVLVIGGGLALDTTRMISAKSHLQHVADATALATSSALAAGEINVLQAEEFAGVFFDGELSAAGNTPAGFSARPVVTVLPKVAGGKTYWTVSVNANGAQQVTPFTAIFGHDEVDISVLSRTESAAGSDPAGNSVFSMVLVLDKSGSMDWYGINARDPANGRPKKIDALKSAVAGLVSQIEESDPSSKLVRMGATAYDSWQRGFENIGWGASRSGAFVSGLVAHGGTASTVAFNWAYTKLRGTAELTAHEQMNGGQAERYIVFMTDGANNIRYDDYSTQKYCTLAKEDGIKIYSVAFMAPPEGEALLRGCASGAEYYFEAEDAAQLVKAFQDIGKGATRRISRIVK